MPDFPDVMRRAQARAPPAVREVRAVIRIVTPERYESCGPLLRQMHRLRYRVFKERMGWDVECQGDEERDRFDRLGPVYILVLDDDEDVAGSWRILPTTGPNMLRDVFPQVLNGLPVPCAPTIWEISRFALDGEGPNGSRGGEAGNGASRSRNSLAMLNSVTSELFCGLIHHCLEHGIEQVAAVYDPLIGRILPRVGVHPLWLAGPPRDGSVNAMVGLFDVDEAVFANVLDCAGFLGLADYGRGQLEPRLLPEIESIGDLHPLDVASGRGTAHQGGQSHAQ
jgi:acyl homoserine lactone synthase